MKLALGLMFTNELKWLKLHLPVFKDNFDGIVAITDPGTTDGSVEHFLSLGADVGIAQWSYNWGDFATKLCDYAESKGYDAIMRVDPDECLPVNAGATIKEELEHATLLCFPRHEFFGDRLHVRPDLWPDYQARAWRLNRGIIVGGAQHEGVNFQKHGLSEHSIDPDHRVFRVANPHIYHYGWASKHGIWENMIKYQSLAQINAGGPAHVAFEPGHPMVSFPTVKFIEPQPIDPAICGATAPYEE